MIESSVVCCLARALKLRANENPFRCFPFNVERRGWSVLEEEEERTGEGAGGPWQPVKGGGEVFGCLGWWERKGDGARRERLLICAAMPDCSSHVSCAAPNSVVTWASRDTGGDTARRRCHCQRTDLTDEARLWTRVTEWTDDRSARRRRLRGHALDENNNIVTAHGKDQGEFLPHAAVLIFVIFYYILLFLLYSSLKVHGISQWSAHESSMFDTRN